MRKKSQFLICLLIVVGTYLPAPGFSALCFSSPPAAYIAAMPSTLVWGWGAGAGIMFLALLAAIIILLNRLGKKSEQLREEKQRHFIASQTALVNERLVEEIYNSTSDSFFFHDLNGTIVEADTRALCESGYATGQLKGLNIKELVSEKFKDECEDYLERIKKNGTDRGIMRITSPSGQDAIIEYNNSLVKNSYGRAAGVRGIARDITEQENTRKTLKKRQEKYRSIIDSIEDAYYEVDLAGNVVFFNNSALRMFGYSAEQLMGKSYIELVDEKDRKTIFETFNKVYHTSKPVKAFGWRLIKKNGSTCYVETSISLNRDKNNNAIGFFGTIRDLTEIFEGREKRRELEAQLHQSQKLESIGTLAGGIAHDFNNILFPIIGYTEMTMEELPQDSPLRGNLEKVRNSAARAKGMIKQILAFSRQNTGQFTEPVNIEPVVKEMVRLLRNAFPGTITIEEKISNDTGKVAIDLSRLSQVTMNLCTNALHAMEDQSSGVLTVLVEQIYIDENKTAGFQKPAPGKYVRICVADTGRGISAGNIGKIFEPYFTTKPQEKGTGLGLSVSYGIVKNAGGVITVKSVAGEGTRFDVLLPVADEHETMAVESDGFSSPLPTGNERILLVDDEHRIMELEKQITESLGYEVVPRTSSIEALEAFRYDPYKFDLVVTDHTMPNMSGMELAAEILTIRPDIPIIICTGFSENVTKEKIKALGLKALLTKPIPKTDMAVTVRRVLDEKKNKT